MKSRRIHFAVSWLVIAVSFSVFGSGVVCERQSSRDVVRDLSKGHKRANNVNRRLRSLEGINTDNESPTKSPTKSLAKTTKSPTKSPIKSPTKSPVESNDDDSNDDGTNTNDDGTNTNDDDDETKTTDDDETNTTDDDKNDGKEVKDQVVDGGSVTDAPVVDTTGIDNSKGTNSKDKSSTDAPDKVTNVDKSKDVETGGVDDGNGGTMGKLMVIFLFVSLVGFYLWKRSTRLGVAPGPFSRPKSSRSYQEVPLDEHDDDLVNDGWSWDGKGSNDNDDDDDDWSWDDQPTNPTAISYGDVEMMTTTTTTDSTSTPIIATTPASAPRLTPQSLKIRSSNSASSIKQTKMSSKIS